MTRHRRLVRRAVGAALVAVAAALVLGALPTLSRVSAQPKPGRPRQTAVCLPLLCPPTPTPTPGSPSVVVPTDSGTFLTAPPTGTPTPTPTPFGTAPGTPTGTPTAIPTFPVDTGSPTASETPLDAASATPGVTPTGNEATPGIGGLVAVVIVILAVMIVGAVFLFFKLR